MSTMTVASPITQTSTLDKMPRRYKPVRNVSKPRREFRPLTPRVRPEWQRGIAAPSRMPTKDCTYKVDNRPTTTATVAPAYNKGAYQVIPRSDVEHIGR